MLKSKPSFEVVIPSFTNEDTEGWAVVGRSDKYLGPAAVESVEAKADSLQMTLIESGPIVVYSATGNPAVDGMESVGLGDGFWRIDLSIGAASEIKFLR